VQWAHMFLYLVIFVVLNLYMCMSYLLIYCNCLWSTIEKVIYKER